MGFDLLVICGFSFDARAGERSLVRRHACFCGGDEPFDKLERALRSEVDEVAWRLRPIKQEKRTSPMASWP